MKKLFVVRHAKSSWDFPELDDFDRPLNNRGKRNAPEMGKRLAERGVKPDKFISSPAKRAAATARRIGEQLGFHLEQIEKNSKFYHGSNRDVIDVIRSTDNNVEVLFIFGHNPGFTDLVNYLSGSNIYNIPTCGIAEIHFDIDSWEGVDGDKGILVDFDYPKKATINHA